MKSFTSYIIGILTGITLTLLILPKLPEILEIKKEEKIKEELDEFDPAECEGCTGPAWIDYKPRCGRYPNSPPCNNPLFRY